MHPLPDTIVYTKFNVLTEYGDYFTLNIPFYCQQSGNCCRKTVFPDPNHVDYLLKNVKELPAILRYFDCETPNDTEKDLKLIIRQQKPCVFLKDNLCQIYPDRPNYCREWFPRMATNCGAFALHVKMSNAVLKGHQYQIGVREVIYIGETKNPTLYPQVMHLDDITKETLKGYQYGLKKDITPFWIKFLKFKPNEVDQAIFLALNPSINNPSLI